MSLATRIDRLEDGHVLDDGGFTLDQLEDEASRWATVLEAVEGLAQDAAARLCEMAENMISTVYYLLKQREDERPQFGQERSTEEVDCRRRWPKAIANLLGAVPAELRDRVLLAGAIPEKTPRWLAYGAEGWLCDWVRDCCQLSCRVPRDVPASAVVSLIDFHLSLPANMTGIFYSACPECGLRVPSLGYNTVQQKYECYPLGCPQCVVIDHKALWPISRIREKTYPWIGLAQQELAFDE
jgi:hypothetical protein